MKKIEELAEQILINIDGMTDLLYQGKVTEGYSLLNNVINQMDQLIRQIVSYQNESNNRIVDETKLLGSVEEAFKAMEGKDTVLLADIFNYDIKEQLEMIVNQ